MKKCLIIAAALLAASNVFAAAEHCASTTDFFLSSAGQTHKVAVLTDPAGQQTALFDLTWGGALVSLKYLNTEYIASTNTTAGSQVILRASNYTPTMAGSNGNRGSIVAGVACSANQLWITSGMTDYTNNASASTAYVFRDNTWYFDHLMAPYVVNTYAHFIPNPAGTPSYYLKIDRTITNIDGTDIDLPENYSFSFDLSTAVPAQYSHFNASPYCDGSSFCTNSAPYMVAGLYNSSALTAGLAVATLPSSQWAGNPGSAWFSTESFSDRRVLHVNRSSWTVAPRAARTHTEYLMVGSWTNAQSYASKACKFVVSTPSAMTGPPYHYPATASIDSATVTAGTGCTWKATSDVSWVSVSPTSGSGNGTVTITIQANTTGQARLGNVNIAGVIYPVIQ